MSQNIENLNRLIAEKTPNYEELYAHLSAGYVVLVDGSLVTVLNLNDTCFFGFSKDHGGVMSFSIADIEKVVSFSQESAEIYGKLWEIC